MAASRQVEILFYRGVGIQRGWGFGAFAQVIGRSAIPFLRKFIVPAAKRVSADLLEFVVPEIASLLVVEKYSRQLQRVWEGRPRKNSWVLVAGKGVRGESFQQNLQNKSVGRGETILQTFLIKHVE